MIPRYIICNKNSCFKEINQFVVLLIKCVSIFAGTTKPNIKQREEVHDLGDYHMIAEVIFFL